MMRYRIALLLLALLLATTALTVQRPERRTADPDPAALPHQRRTGTRLRARSHPPGAAVHRRRRMGAGAGANAGSWKHYAREKASTSVAPT